MAEKKEESVIEKVAEQPKVDNEVGKLKVKKKRKKTETPDVIKVNASKPVEEPVKVNLEEKTKETEETVKGTVDETVVLEEITETPSTVEPVETGLPESVNKLVNFMQDTGGDIGDYIRLNQNYDDWDNEDLIRAYYRDTKSHLTEDEITFVMDDNFKFDEKFDDDKDIKLKKIALKEQVAQAKQHLESVKSKYYEDIKMGSKLNDEQQEALKFFNESKEKQELHAEAQKMFVQKTEELFNDEFKGFEYKVGDKRYRYNINDVKNVKSSQSDLNNFVRKFLNENNQMENAAGYHKGLFTAMNSDAIANHFYEQGKADALKESISKSKNINMDPRQSHSGEIQSGVKVKVLGNNSSDFKFKINKNRKQN